MNLSPSPCDLHHLRRAIELAHEAESAGNLPIGCVICLDDHIVAEGRNAIWVPSDAPYRHAEMEALRALPPELMARRPEMTLYTTLEPCLMCAGAILLHRIGRVVVGAADPYGGAGTTFDRLPTFFREQLATTRWICPAGPEECERLFHRVMELVLAHDA